MADQDTPMPGQTDFSADEEKAMRQGRALSNLAGITLGTLPIMQTARKLFSNSNAAKSSPVASDDATDAQ